MVEGFSFQTKILDVHRGSEALCVLTGVWGAGEQPARKSWPGKQSLGLGSPGSIEDDKTLLSVRPSSLLRGETMTRGAGRTSG